MNKYKNNEIIDSESNDIIQLIIEWLYKNGDGGTNNILTSSWKLFWQEELLCLVVFHK